MDSSQSAKCPFNSNHIVAKHKIHSHITKCKQAKNDPRKLLTCRNDLSKFYFVEDSQLHFSNCDYCRPSKSNDSTLNCSTLSKIRPPNEEEESKSIIWDLNQTIPEITFDEDKTTINTPSIQNNDIIHIPSHMLINYQNPDESYIVEESIVEAFNNHHKQQEQQEPSILSQQEPSILY